MKKKKNKKGIVFLCLGVSLLLIAGVLYLNNLIQDNNAGQKAEELLEKIESHTNDVVIENELPVLNIDGEKFCGKIIVESLGIELPVFNEWSYSLLREAPCRYTGGIETNDMIIAAHNYNSHFGRLKNLLSGDVIKFIDAYGIEHKFAVKEIIKLDGIAVSDMKDGKWDFTLFTCTKGGEYRVTVRCERINNID